MQIQSTHSVFVTRIGYVSSSWSSTPHPVIRITECVDVKKRIWVTYFECAKHVFFFVFLHDALRSCRGRNREEQCEVRKHNSLGQV